jgi:hypothetical protein
MDGGPVVRLRSATDRPYDDAIAAARTCYSPRVIEPDEITDRQRRNIGPLTFDGGHHTVFQHATFEFALSGVSRQLVWSFLHGFPFYNTEQQRSAPGTPTRSSPSASRPLRGASCRTCGGSRTARTPPSAGASRARRRRRRSRPRAT